MPGLVGKRNIRHTRGGGGIGLGVGIGVANSDITLGDDPSCIDVLVVGVDGRLKREHNIGMVAERVIVEIKIVSLHKLKLHMWQSQVESKH